MKTRMSLLAFALLAACVCLPCASGQESRTDAKRQAWWQDTVIYEVYPRSFKDSNGDGIGDLNGITSKLDYLQNLGVEAIWITPCFPSPQVDFGYDVSDYENIDPMYGTLADFDRLVAEAKKRNIRVVLDFVLNHTSDQHKYFSHFFYPEQPDLTGRNPAVEKAMFDTTRFWYKRGVVGFRLDAVDSLYEDPNLTDNPVLRGTDKFG